MDFEFTEAEQHFRAELRQFLADELPDWWRSLFVGDERTIPMTRELCGKLAARGWLTMSWPREHGGQEASTWSQVVLREEMWSHGEPRGPQYMNVNYIGPMIMKFGSSEQKERFLPPMAGGRVLWCQGFSEPGAGSDLPALSTSARRTDAGYVVNGQKIWTSYADAPAEWCFLLVRTDPAARPHQGLSLLLVDMATPGVTVRPIMALAGPGEINEVFFDDVVVPHDCLLGAENTAWSMLRTGLALERTGIAWYATARRFLDRLVEYARTTVVDGEPLAKRPDIRARLAELHCRCEAARLISYRAVSLQERGEATTLESAAAWIHGGLVEQFAGQVGAETVGPLGQLHAGDPEAPIDGWAEFQAVQSIAATIGGGTVDIQRNIVAQAGLGLPRGN